MVDISRSDAREAVVNEFVAAELRLGAAVSTFVSSSGSPAMLLNPDPPDFPCLWASTWGQGCLWALTGVRARGCASGDALDSSGEVSDGVAAG